MFGKNEIVSYGTAGICKIEDIRQEKLLKGEKKPTLYYILRPVYSPDSTIYLPVDNDALVLKMRRIITKTEIDEILEQIRNDSLAWIDDDQKRAEIFNSIISCGIKPELLLLIKCLYERKKELVNTNRKFHAADEKALATAEKIVKEEFAYVLNISTNEVKNYISGVIENGNCTA